MKTIYIESHRAVAEVITSGIKWEYACVTDPLALARGYWHPTDELGDNRSASMKREFLIREQSLARLMPMFVMLDLVPCLCFFDRVASRQLNVRLGHRNKFLIVSVQSFDFPLGQVFNIN